MGTSGKVVAVFMLLLVFVSFVAPPIDPPALIQANHPPAGWQLIVAIVPSLIAPPLTIAAAQDRQQRDQPMSDFGSKSVNNLPLLC